MPTGFDQVLVTVKIPSLWRSRDESQIEVGWRVNGGEKAGINVYANCL